MLAAIVAGTFLFLGTISWFGIFKLLPYLKGKLTKPEHRLIRLAVVNTVFIAFALLPLTPFILYGVAAAMGKGGTVTCELSPSSFYSSTDESSGANHHRPKVPLFSPSEKTQNKEIVAFWDYFTTMEKDLFAAQSPDEPAYKTLTGKLKEVDPDLSFKMGPTHQGESPTIYKRELAFTGGPKSLHELLSTGASRCSSRWIIGTGFTPPAPVIHEPSKSKDSRVKNSDYTFELKRNGGTIDATIYTDMPINDKNGIREPLDTVLRIDLGECCYRCMLGNVTIKKRKEIRPGSKPDVIDHIGPSFQKLMTASEREDVLGPISKKLPVVAYIHVPESTRPLPTTLNRPENVYMLDLHPIGTGVDKIKLEQLGDYNWTISSTELNNLKNPTECLAAAEKCWRSCQLNEAKILSQRVLNSSTDPAEKAIARAFLQCKIPKCQVSQEVRSKFNAAMVDISNNEQGAARQLLHQCIKLAPDFEWSYRHLSTIYRASGDVENAEVVARKCVAVNPDYARGWAELGIVLVQKGDSEAGSVIEKAYKLDPADEQVIAARNLQKSAAMAPLMAPLGRFRDWLDRTMREVDLSG